MGYFKTKIKVLRAEQDMSQDQLAAKVGVRRETIGHVEKGEYNPSLKLAYDISRVFGKQIEEVFLLDDAESQLPTP